MLYIFKQFAHFGTVPLNFHALEAFVKHNEAGLIVWLSQLPLHRFCLSNRIICQIHYSMSRAYCLIIGLVSYIAST